MVLNPFLYIILVVIGVLTMRKFSSYGPVDPEIHYYVPRQALVDFAYQQLLGDNPDKGGLSGPRVKPVKLGSCAKFSLNFKVKLIY